MQKKSKLFDAQQPKTNYRLYGVLLLSVVVFVIMLLERNDSLPISINSLLLGSEENSRLNVRALTWNMAAINNNPFEYWISTDLKSYNDMMENVSSYIKEPYPSDPIISTIFTDAMFEELITQMSTNPKLTSGLEIVKDKWKNDYRNRQAINGFLKDPIIGKKRLISMPDRLTNTISSRSATDAAASDSELKLRPTVVNCYAGDLSTIDIWWTQWKSFFFQTSVVVDKKGTLATVRVVDLLVPISKAKYPAITEEEAGASLPLQLLALAVFDAVLVNTLQSVAPRDWQPVRDLLCNKLNRGKPRRSVEILEKEYAQSDILFLQEVGASFLAAAKSSALGQKYVTHVPVDRDGERDQISVVLLRRGEFEEVREVTSEVLALLHADEAAGKGKVPIAPGDLVALTGFRLRDRQRYLLCSFHGDTNGLATVPTLAAVHKYAVTAAPDHVLLFGMDANSHAAPEKDQLGVDALAEYYRGKGLSSCYGSHPDPVANVTTCHARTYLQPQLNKAVSLQEKNLKGDRNPKDFIVFFASDFAVTRVQKDNTGRRGQYAVDTVFPTLAFPSDHAITSTSLRPLGRRPWQGGSTGRL